MYEEYFGLSGSPFRLNPDPKFFFGSRSHNKAMAYLHYGLKQAEGFIVITGPVGSGKTMLIGQLLDQLNRSDVVAAQLLTSNVGPEDLLGHILSAFRIEPEGEGRTGQLEAFEDYLFDQLNRGRRVLLIMDEAQNLPVKTLEELRMLSNIDYDGTPLFQVFLIGQPEFREIIAAENMEQLRQRIIASYHLESLSEAETKEYIAHRLAVAGWREDPVFSDEALHKIFMETEGRPRRVNTLCNRLMLFCALEKRHEITADIVEKVVDEMQAEKTDEASSITVEPDIVGSMSGENPASGAGKSGSTTKQQALSGGSVFDRLRAKRGGGVEEASEPRQEATLSDVATAIAAASSQAAEAPVDQQAEAVPEPASPKADEPKAFDRRDGFMGAIRDTREELKQAHASVQRLRTSLADMKKRRDNRASEIAKRISRAETLLNELREAWR